MPQPPFATFKEACAHKLDDKQFECGECQHFVPEQWYTKTESHWGTCRHHSHAFLRFRRACYSFEKR